MNRLINTLQNTTTEVTQVNDVQLVLEAQKLTPEQEKLLAKIYNLILSEESDADEALDHLFAETAASGATAA